MGGLANSDRYHPEYVRVVDALVTERKRRGFTQVDMAMRMGTSQSIVSKYERREVLLDLLDYCRYCLAMDLDPGMFIGRFGLALENLVPSAKE
jgi:transcriptional regulator with XRE-family HTH domain